MLSLIALNQVLKIQHFNPDIPIDQHILALNKEEMEIKPFYGSISIKHVQLHKYPFTVNTNDDCII